MPDAVAALVAEAELCLAKYDLEGASERYDEAWAQLDDYGGLAAARLQKWVGNVQLLRGRYGWARSAYKKARDILAELDPCDVDVRAELQRCLADQGQLDLRQGRRTRALRGLCGALQVHSVGEDSDRVRLQLAQVCIGNADAADSMRVQLGQLWAGSAADADNVRALIDGVATRWPDSGTPSALSIRVHEARGLLAAARESYDKAVKEFDFIKTALGSAGDALVLARNMQNWASVLMAVGEPVEARQLLGEILEFYRSCSLEALELVAKTDKGIAELALGAREAAVALFAAVESRYEQAGEGDFDPRERARNFDAWGNADQLAGNLEDAAAKRSEALALLDRAEDLERRDGWRGEPWSRADRAMVLSHLATDHLLTYRWRYVAHARELLAHAAELLEGQAGTEVQVARHRVNLGVTLALLGEFREAEECFRRASRTFRDKRRLLEQVAANHNWGCVIAQSSGYDLERVEEALELLVPAALVRDSVRHALPSSAERTTWWERQAAASVTEAMRVARRTGSAQLITDLVLTFRLPGPMQLESMEDRPSMWLTALPSEPLALDPGPTLKLAYGPQLRLPSGRVALERYLARTRDEYEREVRSDSVAAIAGATPVVEAIELGSDDCVERGS